MAQYRTSRVFDVIFVLTLSGLLWLAYINKVAVMDWVYFLRYSPPAQTSQAATDAGLTDHARKLFYRTDPTFGDAEMINDKCSAGRLGCLDERSRAFILDDPKQPDQTMVTSAHEMLHLAYRRLSQVEKDEIAPEIDRAIQDGGAVLADQLKEMDNSADRRDEAHSILGTEYAPLSDALEEYYRQYFQDRAKVVAAFERSMQ